MNKTKLIRCPVCGREYLPVEIFFPKDVFGSPVDIIRDENGKIIYYSGSEPSYVETYECDKCETTFEVILTQMFECKINKESSFKDDYETPLFKERLFLDEGVNYLFKDKIDNKDNNDKKGE